MVVDLVPVALAIGAILTLIVTAVLALRSKKPLKVWIAGASVTLIFPLLYVWLYHSTVLIYESKAEEGDPEALYTLGASYMHYGRGSPYDPPRGRELLEKAAEKNHVSAQMMLGSLYLGGLSTPPDEKKALGWFRRAKAEGNDDARLLIEEVERGGFDPAHPTGRAAELMYRWIY